MGLAMTVNTAAAANVFTLAAAFKAIAARGWEAHAAARREGGPGVGGRFAVGLDIWSVMPGMLPGYVEAMCLTTGPDDGPFIGEPARVARIIFEASPDILEDTHSCDGWGCACHGEE